MPPTIRSFRLLIALWIVFLPTKTIAQSPTVKTSTSVLLTEPITFTWNDGPEGWVGTNDFVLTDEFTKLGGPIDGRAWVTVCPRFPETYTSAVDADSMGYKNDYPGPNIILSPRFDLSQLQEPEFFISFQQSLSVEAGWDGSWVDYATDDSTWQHLGHLNDSNGLNWYDTARYANAAMLSGDPPDTATMRRAQYRLYGQGLSVPTLPGAWWTSNGAAVDDGHTKSSDIAVPTGPFGWVLCRLLITKAEYPAIFSSRQVRFRYVAFSDAKVPSWPKGRGEYPYEGWAIDNFKIGPGAD